MTHVKSFLVGALVGSLIIGTLWYRNPRKVIQTQVEYKTVVETVIEYKEIQTQVATTSTKTTKVELPDGSKTEIVETSNSHTQVVDTSSSSSESNSTSSNILFSPPNPKYSLAVLHPVQPTFDISKLQFQVGYRPSPLPFEVLISVTPTLHFQLGLSIRF
jgi:hypothetical protein